jgi:hypothetical protein
MSSFLGRVMFIPLNSVLRLVYVLIYDRSMGCLSQSLQSLEKINFYHADKKEFYGIKQ